MTKTKISATVIADSKNEFGQRITSFIVKFPRIILAEFNTHRMFSRNSASSRAIPFEKMLKLVQEDPFIPIAWQKDHKGMQGTEYFTNEEMDHTYFDDLLEKIDGKILVKDSLEREWLNARANAIRQAETLSKLGVTKQICNRLLEPFMYHTVIVTATEWENFFALRCPQYVCNYLSSPESVEWSDYEFRSKKDFIKFTEEPHTSNHSITAPADDEIGWLKLNKGQAEIHAMALAEAMWDAFNASTPKELKAGEWHVPFGDSIDYEKLGEITSEYYKQNSKEEVNINKWLIKIATARCARISYLNFEGKDDYAADFKLHDNLLDSGHMSPFEHCARAMSNDEVISHISGKVPIEKASRHLQVHEIDSSHIEKYGWSGNFKGFIQYRKTIPGENIK